jgi:4'-phosphopantetheinyl transferase
MSVDRRSPATAPEGVDLWLTDYAAIDDPDLLDAYRAMLSDDERAQTPKFFFARDRQRYLVTRALVRSVLSRYAPIAPEEWAFGANEYGCPHVLNPQALRQGLSFNLSHTHSLIALAVVRGRAVGVDIENLRAREPSLAIARGCFAPREVADLVQVPEPDRQYRFFEYWTFKESYIKARGMGLSLPLDGFSFHYPDPHRVALEIAPALEDRPERWRLLQLRPEPDYLLALCVERADGMSPFRVRRVVPLSCDSELAPEVLRASE